MSNVIVKSNRYTVDPLYQWDLNQVLTIYGLSLASIPEIHFTNTGMDRAIVRQATMDDAGVISADVPNSLLQKPYTITAYVCIYEGDTFKSLYAIEIPVKARKKPGDYTIENNEELYSFNALENQIVNLMNLIEDHNQVDNELSEKYGNLDSKYEKAKTDLDNKFTQLDKNVSNNFKQLSQNVTDQLDGFSTDLDYLKTYVTPEMFGGSTDSDDNHDSIISALDYLKENGGGTLLFGSGTYKTSPISLEGYRNIIISGNSPSKPWLASSCLKFISEGSVGLQLSEESGLGYTNEVPTWNAINIHIKHLRIDCNKMVNTGLNCNFDVHLYDVLVDNAIDNGIVFEPQTYPVVLEKTTVRYSGKNGLYVKAPFTTVYNLKDCQFDNNDWYGMYIEDGNTCIISNLILQNNKKGGLKIENKDPSLYSHGVFLGNLTFINVYTENNGLLSETDPGYEGNRALYITSYDTTRYINLGKIPGLTFINCSFNASKTGFKGVIEGVSTPFTVIGPPLTSIVDTSKCGTIYAKQTDNTTLDLINEGHTDCKVHEISMNNETTGVCSFVGDGYIGKRGRMRELHFFLENSGISAGETKMMNTVNPVNYYPILQTGTLYGINLFTPTAPESGTLTVKIKYGYKTSISGGFVDYIELEESIILDSSKNWISLSLPLLKYRIDTSFVLGVEVTASDDYATKYPGYSSLICELFVES